jgi:hypothetical protein
VLLSIQAIVVIYQHTMAFTHKYLMQVIGVADVVDAIIERDIRSNRNDVHAEMSDVFGEADASLMQLASEYYDEFRGGPGVLMNWKDAQGFSEDFFDIALGVTMGLAQLLYAVEDKETFLTVVGERHAGVAYSRMVAVGYMRYAIAYARS